MKKVEAEAEKETELYEKYMCYCKNSGSTLGKSISDADVKIPQLQSDIEEAEGQMKQLKEDVASHQADRAAAKAAMAKATAIREKEAAAYAKSEAELKSNLDAIKKAVAALEAGVSTKSSEYNAYSFAQTGYAAVLKRVILARTDMAELDREDVLAFLSAKQGADGPAAEYVPQSGEVVGILKQLGDEMSKDFAEAKAAEEAAIKAYEELMAAKKKEVEALTAMIEEKLGRIAELGVKIAEMKNDLGDTAEALIEDKKFLADLEKNCATKEKEWAVVCKTRQEELLALADTIKILNDDDALELFKKTLPSASLLQMQVTAGETRQRALAALQAARSFQGHQRPELDLIALCLKGKKIGFEKVIKLIDDMVATLKKEQVDDDNKKEYCDVTFDESDDKKKELERAIADLETSIAKDEDAIVTVKEEIEALEDGIKALDKAVAEATEQRKEENEDFTELMAQDSAAKELILMAKNRMNKFYNPKMYKAPPKRELSEEDRITLNMGGTLAPTNAPGGIAGTGVTALAQEAPPPPPESFGPYAKKSEESSGVLTMMDMLIKDLDKEMTVAQAEEKDAQEDYEKMMADSAEKRAEDSKTLTEREGALADLEAESASLKESKAGADKELGALLEYISSLHAECDWLLKFFDARKEARASEIDALGRAKAVLSGADYSLLQRREARKLRLRGN